MQNHHRHRHHNYSPLPEPKPPKGPYQQQVETLAETGYPDLKYLRDFLRGDVNQSRGQPRCTILQLAMDNKELIKVPGHDPEFCRIVQNFNPVLKPSRSLFILEDLNTAWVEFLGDLLKIDPHFFASYLRSSEYEHNNNKTNAHALPSSRRQRKFTVLSYFKPIVLETPCGLFRTEITNYNILRRMTLRHVKKKKSDPDEITIGLVTRVACYWHFMYDNGSWVGVLLSDPALPSPLRIKSNISDNDKLLHALYWKPYGGGFVDFRPWNEVRGIPRPMGQKDQCMSQDIFYYWMESFPLNDQVTPWDRTNIIIQKIALSDWMLTLAFLRRDWDALRPSEMADPDTEPEEIDRKLTEIASSRDLICKCLSFTRRNLINLGIWPHDEYYFSKWKYRPEAPADETKCDWVFLYKELQYWKQDTENLISSQINLLKVLDSKLAAADSDREKSETRDLNRLTYLGAIFGPVTFTAGIMSMGNEFAPGREKFWIFWVIWIPMSLMIIMYWTMSRVLGRWGMKAKTSFANLRTTQQE